MEFTTIRIPGADALRILNEYRSHYPATGKYPFLIGDREELERIEQSAEFNEQAPGAIIRTSFEIKTAEWIAEQRKEHEEFEFSSVETLGEWPGETLEKGSIGLHKDIVSGRVQPEIYLGLANIEKPWHLPAMLKYGGWNDCPEPEVHCAFYREWGERFGAEITGISADVVECVVRTPPTDRKNATILAWEQYWYCADIVEQGCDSVSNLAATLMNSPYWYFWWD